jgi:Tol biopolymer transport system component
VFARGDGLFIMNANGTALRQLTTCGCDILPAVSPDGQRVAFTRFSGKSDTYVMNVDGTGVTRLTENAGNNTGPAWSPDGTRIAFSSDRDGDQEIYVMNADGTGPVRLTTSPGSDFSPTWSPDGTHIAFVSDRAGGADLGEIFVMNADGTNPVRLTNYPFLDADPAWSPDGSRIAFAREVVVSQSPLQLRNEIVVMNADGSGAVALTNNSAGDDVQPAWSPDGGKIVFASNRSGGDYDLYAVASGGGRASALTHNSLDETHPSWGR